MDRTMQARHEIICQWLGFSPDLWPPDHYTLLGLAAGETDVDLIEHRVQERLEAVRRYQLANPEPATEAMNRLAQAFACLTDRQAKRAYDRQLLGSEAVEADPAPAPAQKSPASAPPALSEAETWVENGLRSGFRRTSMATQRTQLDLPVSDPSRDTPTESPRVVLWQDRDAPPPSISAPLYEPPPVNVEPLEVPPEEENVVEVTPVEKEATALDAIVAAAQTSRRATRGLGTKRALYYRLTRTRALLHAWEAVGEYLGQPQRRLNRPSEARRLIGQLNTIRQLLASFPPLLGEAGQPGYLVVSLARQQVIVPTFQSLLPSQREALARDWNAAQRLLLAHKDFLRQEIRALRRKPFLSRLMRPVLSFLDEHPVGLLVCLGLVALGIAAMREVLR